MIGRQAILLVEDNDDDAELTVKAFARAHVSNPVVRARHGIEALDYLLARGTYAGRDRQDLPAVMLLDLHLPLLDGIEVLKAVRADPELGHLPVVILTSSNEDRDRFDAYSNHVNSFVRKPVNYDRFVTAAAQLGLYWLVLNEPAPLAPRPKDRSV